MRYSHKTNFFKALGKRSLAGNMIMVIVLSVLLISAVSMSGFIIATSRNHQNHNEEELSQYVTFLADSLQLPLWNYDTPAVQKIGQIMMKVERLSFLSIKNTKGKQIFLAERQRNHCDSYQIKNICFRGQVVGEFELCLTDAGFLHQQRDWIISGLINTLMVIIGIMLAVTFCINRFLQKPLSDFSARITAIADGNYEFNASPDVYRELKSVFENIRKMSIKIESRQRELIKSNEKLEGEIDKHRRTERLLRESEEKYRSINDNIPVGFFRIDVDGNIIEYNNFLLNFLGIPADQNIAQYNGKDFYLNPDDRQEIIRKTLHEKEINGFECQIKKEDAHIAWVSISTRVMEDNNGNVLYIDGVFEDITEKRKREEKLLQFAKVIEQAEEEVVITTPKGIIQYVNPSFEKNTGFCSNEVIGKTPSVLKSGYHSRSYYNELWATILNSTPWKGVVKNKKTDGSIILHDTTITPITDSKNEISAFVSIRRDITQQKETENQRYQSQKMQAIGTLAGGIAHDFNNILSGIFGYTQIAQINIKNQEKILDCLSNIFNASQRASELVQQILTFSRQTEYKKLPLCIYPEINEALKLIRSSIPVNIKIEKKLVSRSLISADPTKIHQVVMNLCTNAYHAMEKSGGVLTVSSYDFHLSVHKKLKNKQMPPGKYLALKFSDTGCGMDAKTLEKAFEPYFTTKKIGQGTGLGLPIIQAIVDEHEGFLDVSSAVGKGTQFSLYFPIVERPTRRKRLDPEKKSELEGNETIMLVDDEKSIRDAYKDYLEKHGYKVVVFSDGKEAIETFQADPNRFDIVVTDMTMPEKTGSDLTAVIRSLNKNIPVIICSGFSNLMDETIAHQIGADKYLMKPLQTIDMVTEIRTLLEQYKFNPGEVQFHAYQGENSVKKSE